MKPIEEQADLAFLQALRAVEYRVPRDENLKRSAQVLALSLRYGLMGMAATHHLLSTSDPEDEFEILTLMDEYTCAIEDHVRFEVADRLPFTLSPGLPTMIGRLASEPLRDYIPLYRRFCPLNHALHVTSAIFSTQHRDAICEGWFWPIRSRAIPHFHRSVAESIVFAQLFFERRQADLDELPEIALIGE